MDEQIAALMNVVRREIAVYRDLIEHARRKTAILVRGSLEAILESNRIDEAFNLRLRALEKEMARLCQGLCQTLHITLDDFTLWRLAEGLDQSAAAEIRSQSNLFRHLVEQLKSINQRNRRLAERSVHFSQGLLDFIANATGSYQRSGMLRPYVAVSGTVSSKA
jgi:hypothetical protein